MGVGSGKGSSHTLTQHDVVDQKIVVHVEGNAAHVGVTQRFCQRWFARPPRRRYGVVLPILSFRVPCPIN